jgi:hypothetical protein
VRVGRAAIDEEAIRLIEEHNPEVHFDWARILKFPAPADGARQPAPQPARPKQRVRPGPAEDTREPVEAPVVEEPDVPDAAITESAVLAALAPDDDAPAARLRPRSRGRPSRRSGWAAKGCCVFARAMQRSWLASPDASSTIQCAKS